MGTEFTMGNPYQGFPAGSVAKILLAMQETKV